MKYNLEDLIELEYEKDRDRELDALYWEAVLDSMFDMDSAGDRD